MPAHVEFAIVEGPLQGRTIVLADQETVVFGRAGECGKGTLSPLDLQVARLQFCVQVELPRVYLVELRGTNRTLVNGVACRPGPAKPTELAAPETIKLELHTGDRIRVGKTEFRVRLPEEPITSATAACAACRRSLRGVGGVYWLAGEKAPFCANCIEAARERLAVGNRGVLGEEPARKAGGGGLRFGMVEGKPVSDGHTVVRELLRSGRGRCFLARRREGTEVVLKVIGSAPGGLSARGSLAQAWEKLASEWEAIRRLRHRSLTSVLDYGLAADGSVSAVELEYCPAGNLLQLLERRGVRLLPHTIYDLLADCLEGLVCAHGAGLVHGNLKPQNLLLGSEHEPYAIKLTDFQPKGLWCLTARADGATSDYDQAALPFRPPTQVQNPSAITPEHDVWSLAAIGCLLFTGHAPREPLRDAPGNDASVAERGVPIRQRYRVLPAGADMLFDLIDQTLAGQITSAAEMQQALLRTARPPGLTCG